MAIRVSRKQLTSTVVAIDPAVTSGEDSDETGIIVVARGPHQPDTCRLDEICPGHGYVLDDLTCRDTPSGWARRAVEAYEQWRANLVVAEVNNGGDMVGITIKAVRNVPYEAVRATKGKLTRAEPASALYEQGRVHHLGSFPELEDQLTNWTPTQGSSPDRLDALVWGLTALKLIGALDGLTFSLSDEEWEAAEVAYAQANGLLPKPVRMISNFGIGGDTSWEGAGIVPDGEYVDPDERPNGKVARSPFA